MDSIGHCTPRLLRENFLSRYVSWPCCLRYGLFQQPFINSEICCFWDFCRNSFIIVPVLQRLFQEFFLEFIQDCWVFERIFFSEINQKFLLGFRQKFLLGPFLKFLKDILLRQVSFGVEKYRYRDISVKAKSMQFDSYISCFRRGTFVPYWFFNSICSTLFSLNFLFPRCIDMWLTGPVRVPPGVLSGFLPGLSSDNPPKVSSNL